MQWNFIVALILAIPIIAFPALLWYLDIGRSYAAIRRDSKRKAAHREEKSTAVAGQRETVGRRSKLGNLSVGITLTSWIQKCVERENEHGGECI